MPRFVILEHDHPTLHWDLMLQAGETLRSWRLARAPVHPGDAIEAIAIGDHRPMYLDYEGPVSGGRGKVARWDYGTYEEEKQGNVRSGERLAIRLQGQRVQGSAILEHVAGDQWSFRITPSSPKDPTQG